MIVDTFQVPDRFKGESVPFEDSNEIRVALESLSADGPHQNGVG